MALSYKARRRWSLFILLIGLPAYIIVASSIMTALGDLPGWAEFAIYVALGIVWVLPFKAVFRGVGREEPAAQPDENTSGD